MDYKPEDGLQNNSLKKRKLVTELPSSQLATKKSKTMKEPKNIFISLDGSCKIPNELLYTKYFCIISLLWYQYLSLLCSDVVQGNSKNR